MADQTAPSSSAAAEGARADEPTTLGGAKTVDTYPEAERLLQQGVAVFSRGVLDIVQQQIQGSTAELRALDKVNQVAAAQYSELKDNLGEIDAFYARYNEQVAALKPHLASIDKLDAVVSELENAAQLLDQQTRQLEAALADVLS